MKRNEKEPTVPQQMVENGIICPFSNSENLWCFIKDDCCGKSYQLSSSSFRLAFKSLYKKHYGELLNNNEYAYMLDELEVMAFENKLDYPLSNRICKKDGAILYDLQESENLCVRIENGICKIEQTPKMIFKRTSLSVDQVAPNFSIDPTTLPKILSKHLNIRSKKILQLYSIWLVTCFLPDIQHPILVSYGEKGSSKSTLLKRTVQIIDPQTIELTSMPSKAGDIDIRLSSTYVCAFDNISPRQLTLSISNLFCQTVTSGASPKRKLYSDSELVITDIKSILLLDGTDLVISKSDLMERALLIPMKKLGSQKLQNEISLEQSFGKALPDILGACFQLVAIACNDTKPIETDHKTRIASFYDTAIRVGRALGFEDSYTDELLWMNQKRINQETLTDSVIAQCLRELMSKQTEYRKSVTDLLNDLKGIGEILHIPPSEFPNQPNRLSRLLNELKSNLEAEYGISYKICNIGKCKEIRITRRTDSDSTDDV